MKVSIIMPAHNAAKTIKESIDSVLSQTFTDWELLVINDSSIDETEQIVSEYTRKDSRIRLLYTDKSVGKPFYPRKNEDVLANKKNPYAIPRQQGEIRVLSCDIASINRKNN